MEQFSVSVIIPVYNAEAFLEKAIKSALQQPEVTEVIVANDGSTDGSLKIAEEQQQKDSRVKIYHHKNNLNKGRSASRNLGIEKSNANYIAFLDADDYYLENRFANDKTVFEGNKNIDGVYNAIGAKFYVDKGMSKLAKAELKLYTVRESIAPEKLFEALITGKHGHFSIDGLSVKKTVFDKIGLFNEELHVSEDTELFWRLALKCSLKSGLLENPVAIRGVHESNVFNNKGLYKIHRIKMYEALVIWASENKIQLNKIDLMLKWLWLIKYNENDSLTGYILYWSSLFRRLPKLYKTNLWIKYFPLVRLRQKLFPFLYKK